MLIWDQFVIIQNLQMSTILQTVFLPLTFFAAFYSKTALVLAQLSCSLDPTTNSKTTNPNFLNKVHQKQSEALKHLCKFRI